MLGTQIVSKTEQLRQIILEEIKSGNFKEDAALPSENVLSSKFGVSRNTVREAISSLVCEGCLFRIQGKGTFLKKGATDLIDRKSFYLINKEKQPGHGHYLYDEGYYSFFSTLLLGMHDVLDLLEKNVKVFFLPPQLNFKEYFQKNGSSIDDLRCGGALMGGYEISNEEYQLFLDNGIKCVSIGLQAKCPHMPYVDADHEFGAYSAVKHLTGLGHQRIAVLDRTFFQSAFEKRKRGFIKAFDEEGLDRTKQWCLQIPEECSAEEIVDELLVKIPDVTAVIVYGDIASVIFYELQKKGLSVPKDVSLVKYAGSAIATDIKFTEVSQSVRELSKAASRMLLEAVSEKDKIVKPVILKPKLVIGETTAKAR